MAASAACEPMSFRVTVLVVLIGLSLSHVARAETWRRHTNERFGTSVEVPADFAPLPPSTDNDGRTFVSKDGSARILVYGSNAPSVVAGSFAAYLQGCHDGMESLARREGRLSFGRSNQAVDLS